MSITAPVPGPIGRPPSEERPDRSDDDGFTAFVQIDDWRSSTSRRNIVGIRVYHSDSKQEWPVPGPALCRIMNAQRDNVLIMKNFGTVVQSFLVETGTVTFAVVCVLKPEGVFPCYGVCVYNAPCGVYVGDVLPVAVHRNGDVHLHEVPWRADPCEQRGDVWDIVQDALGGDVAGRRSDGFWCKWSMRLDHPIVQEVVSPLATRDFGDKSIQVAFLRNTGLRSLYTDYKRRLRSSMVELQKRYQDDVFSLREDVLFLGIAHDTSTWSVIRSIGEEGLHIGNAPSSIGQCVQLTVSPSKALNDALGTSPQGCVIVCYATTVAQTEIEKQQACRYVSPYYGQSDIRYDTCTLQGHEDSKLFFPGHHVLPCAAVWLR